MTITSLLYLFVAVLFAGLLLVLPRRRFRQPPTPDNDDEGGEPLDDGLPDFDLPPGISRPINDWEPDYNYRPVIKE
ncbi:hypothetical protein [Hymenobacter rubripertinctus]|uniref:Uncharacterized protein n=1 Tax=Hymenobacter rubripertinctus TaxID=2029981 RepID=A0A418QJK8_9BACT|nr:hypothetical protein [Hymenobacter rubripertinctus]RIY05322.1 hypothetical protein D0T11_20615 [Hymenobacter rubripertinctus]